MSNPTKEFSMFQLRLDENFIDSASNKEVARELDKFLYGQNNKTSSFFDKLKRRYDNFAERPSTSADYLFDEFYASVQNKDSPFRKIFKLTKPVFYVITLLTAIIAGLNFGFIGMQVTAPGPSSVLADGIFMNATKFFEYGVSSDSDFIITGPEESLKKIKRVVSDSGVGVEIIQKGDQVVVEPTVSLPLGSVVNFKINGRPDLNFPFFIEPHFEVTGSYPENNQRVADISDISVDFSKKVDIDSLANSLKVYPAFKFEIQHTGKQVKIIPENTLSGQYKLIIPQTVKTTRGEELQRDFELTFFSDNSKENFILPDASYFNVHPSSPAQEYFASDFGELMVDFFEFPEYNMEDYFYNYSFDLSSLKKYSSIKIKKQSGIFKIDHVNLKNQYYLVRVSSMDMSTTSFFVLNKTSLVSRIYSKGGINTIFAVSAEGEKVSGEVLDVKNNSLHLLKEGVVQIKDTGGDIFKVTSKEEESLFIQKSNIPGKDSCSLHQAELNGLISFSAPFAVPGRKLAIFGFLNLPASDFIEYPENISMDMVYSSGTEGDPLDRQVILSEHIESGEGRLFNKTVFIPENLNEGKIRVNFNIPSGFVCKEIPVRSPEPAQVVIKLSGLDEPVVANERVDFVTSVQLFNGLPLSDRPVRVESELIPGGFIESTTNSSGLAKFNFTPKYIDSAPQSLDTPLSQMPVTISVISQDRLVSQTFPVIVHKAGIAIKPISTVFNFSGLKGSFMGELIDLKHNRLIDKNFKYQVVRFTETKEVISSSEGEKTISRIQEDIIVQEDAMSNSEGIVDLGFTVEEYGRHCLRFFLEEEGRESVFSIDIEFFAEDADRPVIEFDKKIYREPGNIDFGINGEKELFRFIKYGNTIKILNSNSFSLNEYNINLKPAIYVLWVNEMGLQSIKQEAPVFFNNGSFNVSAPSSGLPGEKVQINIENAQEEDSFLIWGTNRAYQDILQTNLLAPNHLNLNAEPLCSKEDNNGQLIHSQYTYKSDQKCNHGEVLIKNQAADIKNNALSLRGINSYLVDPIIFKGITDTVEVKLPEEHGQYRFFVSRVSKNGELLTRYFDIDLVEDFYIKANLPDYMVQNDSFFVQVFLYNNLDREQRGTLTIQTKDKMKSAVSSQEFIIPPNDFLIIESQMLARKSGQGKLKINSSTTPGEDGVIEKDIEIFPVARSVEEKAYGYNKELLFDFDNNDNIDIKGASVLVSYSPLFDFKNQILESLNQSPLNQDQQITKLYILNMLYGEFDRYHSIMPYSQEELAKELNRSVELITTIIDKADKNINPLSFSAVLGICTDFTEYRWIQRGTCGTFDHSVDESLDMYKRLMQVFLWKDRGAKILFTQKIFNSLENLSPAEKAILLLIYRQIEASRYSEETRESLVKSLQKDSDQLWIESDFLSANFLLLEIFPEETKNILEFLYSQDMTISTSFVDLLAPSVSVLNSVVDRPDRPVGMNGDPIRIFINNKEEYFILGKEILEAGGSGLRIEIPKEKFTKGKNDILLDTGSDFYSILTMKTGRKTWKLVEPEVHLKRQIVDKDMNPVDLQDIKFGEVFFVKIEAPSGYIVEDAIPSGFEVLEYINLNLDMVDVSVDYFVKDGKVRGFLDKNDMALLYPVRYVTAGEFMHLGTYTHHGLKELFKKFIPGEKFQI